MFKAFSMAAVVLTLGLSLVTGDAMAAKRLGSGKSTGMQRESVTQPHTPHQAPAQPGVASASQPTAAAAAAPAAAASKRSWLGPVAGLAAGLGLAALASHFGFGEELATFMMLALLAVVVMAVIGMVLRKRAGAGQPALAGAAAGAGQSLGAGNPVQPSQGAWFQQASNTGSVETAPRQGPQSGSMIGAGLAAGAQRTWPADFDAVAFAQHAKSQFLALQAANDAARLDEIGRYTTPEMFQELSADIAARGPQPATEIRSLDASVLDVAEEAQRYVVTVRFTGWSAEPGANPEAFDEYWHLTKPRQGMGGWLLSGIQQAV